MSAASFPLPGLFTCANGYVDAESYPSSTGSSCSTFSNVVINNQIDSVMAKAAITLHDVAYTPPRQSLCIFYPTTNPLPANCPTL